MMSENILVIEHLQQRIRELKASLPAHSVPPGMLIELEELEEQLAEMIKEAKVNDDASA